MPIPFTTQEIAASDSAKIQMAAGADDFPVSQSSRFGDAVWRLDSTTPGQHPAQSSIRWEFELPDGCLFTDRKHARLRYSLKRFAWSLFADPRQGPPMAPGSATHISRALRYLVRWMVRRDYSALSELNATASQEYLEDLARDLAEADETDPEIIPEATGSDDGASPGGKTVTSVVGRINIWRLLWRQSGALKDAGIDPLPNVPFAGRSPKSLAHDLATKTMGWISPIPDEVALPIMAAAHRMLGVPAADVIRLHRLYLDARAAASHCSVGRQALLAGKAIAGFAFSPIEGQNSPWRVSLYPTTSRRLHHGAWHTSHLDVHQALRALIEDVCAACIIVLQSEAGIRINEVCGLRAGTNPDTRLPVCIEVRRSKTGLHELFFLKGTLAKTRPAPVEAEWLLGARPVGIKEIPAPVRAVQVLQELYAPLRSLPTNGTRCKDLIVQMTWPRGLPKNSRMIGKILGGCLLAYQRQFIGTYVDLSGLPDRNRHGENLAQYRTSRGACLRSHSWRKTFALYVFRTDSRMIAAIAQQFHHLSLAMTEQGYLGSDPTLLEVMDSVRTRQTALFFYEMARGVRPIAGRMAKLIDAHRTELEGIIAGLEEREGLFAMERWVVKQDLRIWFSSHGKCFLRLAPGQARCHQLAGTAHWANREPNYTYRSPEVCLGCPAYAIDGEHEVYWVRRYLENQTAWMKAVAGGYEKDYRISEFRALQSAAVMQAIGVGLPRVETETRYARAN
jgi:integrase